MSTSPNLGPYYS